MTEAAVAGSAVSVAYNVSKGNDLNGLGVVRGLEISVNNQRKLSIGRTTWGL